jgi:hypothetical protein
MTGTRRIWIRIVNMASLALMALLLLLSEADEVSLRVPMLLVPLLLRVPLSPGVPLLPGLPLLLRWL